MKEEIKYREGIAKTKWVEIEYPFYKLLDCGGDTYSCIIYWKVFSRFKGLLIEKSHDFLDEETSYEVNFYKKDMLSGSDKLDFILGLGEFECSEQEFETIFKEMKETLDEWNKKGGGKDDGT